MGPKKRTRTPPGDDLVKPAGFDSDKWDAFDQIARMATIETHRGNVKVGERKQHKLDQEAKKASMNALRHKKQAANKEQKAWLNALLESNPDAKEGMEQHGFCKIKECMPDEVMKQFVKIAGDTAFYRKAGTIFNDKPFYRDAWGDDEIPDKGKEYCEPPWSPLHPPLSLLGPALTPFVLRVHV